MSVTSLSLRALLSYTLQNNAALGQPSTQPGTGQNFTLTRVSTSTWDGIYASTFTVYASATAPTGLSSSLVAGGSLTSAQPYYYKITAIGPNGTLPTNTLESGPSGETTQTPSGGNLSIKLTWTAFQGASSYNIYRGTSTGAENLLVGTVTGNSTVTFTDTGFAGSSQSPPSAPNAYIEFDISSFTDQVNDATTVAHVLGIMILPTGTNATCVLEPGQTNGLQWFFGGTTQTVTIPISGVFLLCNPASGTGQVVDSTHKTIRITNGGTAALTANVLIICSDQ